MELVFAGILLLIAPIVAVFGFSQLYNKKNVTVGESLGEISEFDRKLIKKYEEVNLHRNRYLSLILGSLLSVSAVYLMVEWTQYDDIEPEVIVDNSNVQDKFEEIPETKIEPPKPPPKKVSKVMKIVEDEELLEEIDSSLVEEIDTLDFYDPDEEEEIEEEEEEEAAPEIFFNADVMPEAPGGDLGFESFLMESIPKYCDLAAEMDNQGMIMAKFIVNENGALSGISIEEGLSPGLDAAVLKSLQRSPRWVPAKIDGQAVKLEFYYPMAIFFE